ncbi:MAG: hypothetical protein HFJ75_00795, partial [Eggerthellaceae bacterium]|nr:hypothetical protein [Eggerthellaceae bacterium]
RLDEVLYEGTGRIDTRLAALKEEFERLSESTVAEKTELNWAFNVKPTHAAHLAKLWLTNEPANYLARLRGEARPACSDFDYPDQQNGVRSPAWNADGTANCTFKGEVTDGMGDGRALSDEDGNPVAAAGSVVAPGFSRANTNEAFDAANAQLEAGRAGTSSVAGAAPAVPEAARATVARDPLLEQMMAEEAERAAAEAAGEGVRGRGRQTRDAGGLRGAGGRAGARDARKLDKLRDRRPGGESEAGASRGDGGESGTGASRGAELGGRRGAGAKYVRIDEDAGGGSDAGKDRGGSPWSRR